MKTVTVDVSTRDELMSGEGLIELRDTSGQLLGRFVKVTRAGQFLISGRWPTDEVIAAHATPGTGYTAEEVEEYMRRLTKQPPG
jgi:hypothetical protein